MQTSIRRKRAKTVVLCRDRAALVTALLWKALVARRFLLSGYFKEITSKDVESENLASRQLSETRGL